MGRHFIIIPGDELNTVVSHVKVRLFYYFSPSLTDDFLLLMETYRSANLLSDKIGFKVTKDRLPSG